MSRLAVAVRPRGGHFIEADRSSSRTAVLGVAWRVEWAGQASSSNGT